MQGFEWLEGMRYSSSYLSCDVFFKGDTGAFYADID